MRIVKLSVFLIAIFISQNVFSAAYICGIFTSPTTGEKRKVCHHFYMSNCNDADFLEHAGEAFPGGWTCHDHLANSNNDELQLVLNSDGNTYVLVNDQGIQIVSDQFVEFLEELHRETVNMRVSSQAKQDRINDFLDTDDGSVSEVRLKRLSRDLGVPIQYEASSNPGKESGRPPVDLGSQAVEWNSTQPTAAAARGVPQSRASVKIPADSCSLPECACRVVSSSGESLCEGGIEGETQAGVHFCKCGQFGYSAAQGGGAGGDFTVGYGSQPAPPAAEPLAATAASAQMGQAGRQRPVSPIPPATELFYRTFTATQLGQSSQPATVNQTGRGASATMPNTANVVEEIFRRGLGPIVLGLRGQMNADGTQKPFVVLNNQEDVFNVVNPTARGRGADAPAQGRQMSRQPSMGRDQLQRNLVALKVNMIICENGITVNDPGMGFGDLSLAQDFSPAQFPIYDSCEKCNAACGADRGVCFMTVDLKCRCYLFYLDPMRATSPRQIESIESTMPRRLRDLAAFADDMLTNGQKATADDFDALNETIEIVNGAFASDMPLGPQDLVQWGGRDGALVLKSVRPLSEVPFLVTGR